MRVKFTVLSLAMLISSVTFAWGLFGPSAKDVENAVIERCVLQTGCGTDSAENPVPDAELSVRLERDALRFFVLAYSGYEAHHSLLRQIRRISSQEEIRPGTGGDEHGIPIRKQILRQMISGGSELLQFFIAEAAIVFRNLHQCR